MLSAVMLGVEMDLRSSWDALGASSLEFALCVTFVADIAVRFSLRGWHLFSGKEWAWNTFDLLVVTSQVIEFMYGNLRQRFVFLSHVGLIRLLRFVRIFRLFRVVRFFQALRSILTSIVSSLASLGWTLFLLLLVLYVFSLFFTLVVHEAYVDDPPETLSYWYGSVCRTMLTLFESVAGGVSWDEAVAPMTSHVSPWLGLVFVAYVVIASFVLLSIVSAYFVESATRTAQEERHMALANHISDTFFKEDGDLIGLEEFSAKLQAPEMQEYFKAIDLDPMEAWVLFDLLDEDGTGMLTSENVINGCLRLRGSAKAIDLSRLVKCVDRRLCQIQHDLLHCTN